MPPEVGLSSVAAVSPQTKKNPSGNHHLYFTYSVLFINGRTIFVLFITVLHSECVFGYWSITIPQSFCMLGDIS